MFPLEKKQQFMIFQLIKKKLLICQGGKKRKKISKYCEIEKNFSEFIVKAKNKNLPVNYNILKIHSKKLIEDK